MIFDFGLHLLPDKFDFSQVFSLCILNFTF
jgi:hypothetical protein